MWRRWGTPQNSFLAFIGELKKQIISSISQWYDLKFLRYRANILKLIILGHFLPSPPPRPPPPPLPLLPPPKKLQNQHFEKWKNFPEISSFYTCAPKLTIIWSTVLEIRSETDRTFYHFLPFYHPMDPKSQNFEQTKKAPDDIITLQMCTINDSHVIYGSWDMECKVQIFLSFWTIFWPFTPNKTKNLNFEKMKKTPRDTIILHMRTINDNQMMYCSWDMKCDEHNFLSF